MATINVATLANELGTDARTTRKFLRSITPRDEQPGKGARWEIEKRSVRSLRSKYAKWEEELEARKAAKEAETDKADEVLEEDNSDIEPTDAELAEIDDEA